MASDKHDDESVTIGVIISRKHMGLIDAWAERLRHSRSKMSRIILETSIEDDGWMWRLLTSGPGLSILKLLGGDFSKPLDDENKRALRKMISQASPAALVEIMELCGSELKRQEQKAA